MDKNPKLNRFLSRLLTVCQMTTLGGSRTALTPTKKAMEPMTLPALQLTSVVP